MLLPPTTLRLPPFLIAISWSLQRSVLKYKQRSLVLYIHANEGDQGVNPQQAASDLANAGASVLKIFDSDVFSGASVLSDTHNLDTLQSLTPVLRSWHSRKIKLTAPIATAQTFGPGAASASFSVHHMTGVDKLHEAGILGRGAKVAVVDTGVWYPHHAVRESFHFILARDP